MLTEYAGPRDGMPRFGLPLVPSLSQVSASVLIVEDEALVRALGVGLFADAGFRPIEAVRALPEKKESEGIPLRARIGFKNRAGREASTEWASRIRRICVHG